MIDVDAGDDGRDVQVGGQRLLPATLPVLPLREAVPLPDTLTPLAIGQERSIQLVNDVLAGNRMLVMVASKDPRSRSPAPSSCTTSASSARSRACSRSPTGPCASSSRAPSGCGSGSWARETPYLVAEVEELPDAEAEGSTELEALTRNVRQTFSAIVEDLPYLPEELQLAVANVDDPGALSHLIAGSLRLPPEEKQELLEEVDVARRLRRLTEILARELEVISIGTKIQTQVQSEIDKGQREFVLRQQLEAIRRELGEFDESAAEAGQLRERLEQIPLPEEVRRQVDRELKRLESLPPQAAEHGVIRTWLEWIASLPWGRAPRTTSTCTTRARCSTPTTTTSSRSRTASSSSWPCGA